MFYVILGIVVIVALFLIFRDDSDGAYNRNEKSPKRLQYQKDDGAVMKATEVSAGGEPKAAEKVTRPAVKEILGEIEEASSTPRGVLKSR